MAKYLDKIFAEERNAKPKKIRPHVSVDATLWADFRACVEKVSAMRSEPLGTSDVLEEAMKEFVEKAESYLKAEVKKYKKSG